MPPFWPVPTLNGLASAAAGSPRQSNTANSARLTNRHGRGVRSAAMGPLSREELEPTLRPLHEASMLPPRVYVDETVAAWEAERLFLDGWVCAGHVSSMAERGVYLTREVGGESLLVVGDDDGRARAFFNVCRHRGARLVEGEEGTLRRIQCPYHAWSYAFDGTLRNAPHTDELADFDPSCFGLTPVRSAVVGGLVLLDVGGTAAPADEH